MDCIVKREMTLENATCRLETVCNVGRNTKTIVKEEDLDPLELKCEPVEVEQAECRNSGLETGPLKPTPAVQAKAKTSQKPANDVTCVMLEDEEDDEDNPQSCSDIENQEDQDSTANCIPSCKESHSPRKRKIQNQGELKIRRKPEKKRRLFGQCLTGSRAMPKLSDSSVASIEAGEPNMHLILADIRTYIHMVTGDLYPTIQEYKNMCYSLIQKYPALADADDSKGYSGIKASISASLRQARNYVYNVKPRMIAAKKLRSVQKKVVFRSNIDNSAEEQINKELQELTSESLSDRGKVMSMITKTLSVREAEFIAAHLAGTPADRTQNEKAVWQRYPHFEDGRLLIYEYCLRVNQRQEDLKVRYDGLIQELKKYYRCDGASHLHGLDLLEEAFTELTPSLHQNKGIPPPLVIKDITEVLRHQASQDKHAPCVLVTSTDDEHGKQILAHAYLKMHGQAYSSIEKTTAFEAVVLLVAPYFVGDITYPDAYKSFLRFIEKMLNGGLCSKTQAQRPHKTYNLFMKKFSKTSS